MTMFSIQSTQFKSTLGKDPGDTPGYTPGDTPGDTPCKLTIMWVGLKGLWNFIAQSTHTSTQCPTVLERHIPPRAYKRRGHATHY